MNKKEAKLMKLLHETLLMAYEDLDNSGCVGKPMPQLDAAIKAIERTFPKGY